MFDKLFELLKTIWNEIVPYFVVSEMELAWFFLILVNLMEFTKRYSL
jgi:hypothetical protein